MKSLLKNLGPGNQQARVCGICDDRSHLTDACPQLQDNTAEVNAASGFGPPRPGFERQGYNTRANDHPGFRWSDPSSGQQPYRSPYNPQQNQQFQSRPMGPSTTDMLKELTKHFTTRVKTTEASIKNLKKQVGQHSSDVSNLVNNSSNGLLSQTKVNPQI